MFTNIYNMQTAPRIFVTCVRCTQFCAFIQIIVAMVRMRDGINKYFL